MGVPSKDPDPLGVKVRFHPGVPRFVAFVLNPFRFQIENQKSKIENSAASGLQEDAIDPIGA